MKVRWLPCNLLKKKSHLYKVAPRGFKEFFTFQVNHSHVPTGKDVGNKTCKKNNVNGSLTTPRPHWCTHWEEICFSKYRICCLKSLKACGTSQPLHWRMSIRKEFHSQRDLSDVGRTWNTILALIIGQIIMDNALPLENISAIYPHQNTFCSKSDPHFHEKKLLRHSNNYRHCAGIFPI